MLATGFLQTLINSICSGCHWISCNWISSNCSSCLLLINFVSFITLTVICWCFESINHDHHHHYDHDHHDHYHHHHGHGHNLHPHDLRKSKVSNQSTKSATSFTNYTTAPKQRLQLAEIQVAILLKLFFCQLFVKF